FDVPKASAIYGLFTSMVFLLSLPGGWIADRFLGQRRAVLYGGILIAAGNALLALPGTTTFYAGLAVIVAGTGLLKPNVSTLVGQLYHSGDARRDSGFSIYYMGINLGAFLSPLACGYLGQNVNWHLGFVLAAVGMALGLVQYTAGARHLGEAGLHPVTPASPADAASQRKWLRLGLGITAAAIALALILHSAGMVELTAGGLSDVLGGLLFLTVAAFFAWALFLGDWTPEERKRMIVVGILFAASCLFWSVFEQAGSTLNLFAQRNTENRIFGWPFPASWLQSLNALFIISLAPVFAWLWIRMGRREPSSTAKFVIGLLCAGAGFLLLVWPAAASAGGSKVSPMWLAGVYLLHTIGELCLSPVGLSAMTRLAPARFAGLLMGVWFVSLSVGNYLGGRISAFYEALPLEAIFGVVGGFGIAAAVVLAFLVKPAQRLTGPSR
ncbi:MAG: peptide MFS transporter, partial [Bryobacteraceae bacterium]